jgi:hypothetical protein
VESCRSKQYLDIPLKEWEATQEKLQIKALNIINLFVKGDIFGVITHFQDPSKCWTTLKKTLSQQLWIQLYQKFHM